MTEPLGTTFDILTDAPGNRLRFRLRVTTSKMIGLNLIPFVVGCTCPMAMMIRRHCRRNFSSTYEYRFRNVDMDCTLEKEAVSVL